MTINGNSPNQDSKSTASNPFDPASLRLDQSFAEKAGVKKLITIVPVRKPNRQDFVRVHPDPSYRLSPAGIIEIKEDRETYLVVPSMAQELQSELVPATLFTAITRQGVIFIWPIKLPGPDGKHNAWPHSAMVAAKLAEKTWIRVCANMHLGAYEPFEAQNKLSEPVWSDVPPFEELLRTAFSGRIVDNSEHPLVRRLRGIT
jgi:hypothetical protein